MRSLLLIAFCLVAGGCTHAPLTAEENRQLRVNDALRYCTVACPQGAPLGGDPQTCCTDYDGITWTACAWNGCGRFDACHANVVAEGAGGCGGPGWPECGHTEASR